MANQDLLHRFLFDNHPVRGEIVTLNDSYQQLLSNHQYPAPVARLMGELLVATSLLTATIKFRGTITVQLQGQGPVKLAVINGSDQQQFRGVARVDGLINDEMDFRQLFGQGMLVITITPEQGERYQGMVALEQDSLAACLEDYFRQSEQLATRLWLFSDGKTHASGLFLQMLPSAAFDALQGFEHLSTLAQTTTITEMQQLAADAMLYRLYHEEQLRLFEPSNIEYRCTCSRDKCINALASVDNHELQEMLHQDGEIRMHCDYCGTDYCFDANDISELQQQNQLPSPTALH